MKSPVHFFPFKLIEHSKEDIVAKMSTRSQVIYITVVLFTIATVISLPLIKMDVVTSAKGIIKSVQNNNRITSLVNGQVTQSKIQENQFVKKGDTLLVLDDSQLKSKIQHQLLQIEQHNESLDDLKKLLQIDSSFELGGLGTPAYRQEALHFLQQKEELLIQKNHLKDQLNLQKELYATSTIAKTQLQQSKHEYALMENRLFAYEQQKLSKWADELRQVKNSLETLLFSTNQLQIELESYIIRAAMDGYLINVENIQPGNFLSVNRTIGQISADHTYRIEAYLSPAKIGLIQKGMDVKFQVDAFNYNQWGLADGYVDEISKDLIQNDQQYAFVVYCHLGQEELCLKNGSCANLTKGLTVNARFLIARRSLGQLLYDQVDDWFNPNQI